MYKITVFCCKHPVTLDSFKEILEKKTKHVDYTEFDFHRVSHDERVRLGGEGKIVLSTFSRFVAATVSDVKDNNRLRGITAFVDGFINRIDEFVNIAEYFKPLLDVCDVFYFTGNKGDADRLSALPVDVYVLTE